MNDPIGLVDLDGRLAHLREDTARLAACLEKGDLRTPIAACPGWDLRQLAVHLGGVHRWATHAIQDAAPPTDRSTGPADDVGGAALAAWLRLGAGVLADVLATTRPNSRTWHPFPVGQIAWVWSRRLLVETALHRWDGETAVVGTSSLDPAMAAMGIGEYFHLGVPRVLQQAGLATPTPSLHVHCTDASLPDGTGEWTVWNDDGTSRLDAGHGTADAELRGTAEQLLLVLHGRADRSSLDIVGDSDAADAWLDLPGW